MHFKIRYSIMLFWIASVADNFMHQSIPYNSTRQRLSSHKFKILWQGCCTHNINMEAMFYGCVFTEICVSTVLIWCMMSCPFSNDVRIYTVCNSPVEKNEQKENLPSLHLWRDGKLDHMTQIIAYFCCFSVENILQLNNTEHSNMSKEAVCNCSVCGEKLSSELPIIIYTCFLQIPVMRKCFQWMGYFLAANA